MVAVEQHGPVVQRVAVAMAEGIGRFTQAKTGQDLAMGQATESQNNPTLAGAG